jgi:hypothetical protein
MYLGGELHDPPLYPWYPMNMGIGGPQRRCEHFGEEINLLPLPVIKI